MSKTVVVYKDFAVGADADAAVSTTGSTPWSETDRIPFGLQPQPIATLEPESWLLDGSRVFRDTQRVAYWSTTMSGADGYFTSDPPTITFELDKQYTSLGISIIASPGLGDWCGFVGIKWYRGPDVIADKMFLPDSPDYFCAEKVELFDKVSITLFATNRPNRYAKIDQIAFGVVRKFGMGDLRGGASVTNQADLTGRQLPASTFDWVLRNKGDVDYLFQLKQPIEIRNGDRLLGTYYVDRSERRSDGDYHISCHDAIGVLSGSDFPGGDYTKGISATALLKQIVGEAFELDVQVPDRTLYGILRKASRRDAARQVIFAMMGVATTDGTSKIRVVDISKNISSVGPGRTFPGSSVRTAAVVTEVRVTAHKYTKLGDGWNDVQAVYSVKNPDVTAGDKENVISIEDCTLISADNAQQVAQRLYDYCTTRRNSVDADIVWAGESLADTVSLPTSWGQTFTGGICKAHIKLSNTIVASVATNEQGAL